MNSAESPLTSTPQTVPHRAPETVVQHFAEESLLMDPGSSYTCALNPTGAAVWELIDGRRSIGEIAALLAKATGVQEARACNDVRHFVDEMSRRGFVRLGEQAGEPFTVKLRRLTEAVEEAARQYEREHGKAARAKLYVPSEPARLFGALQAARRHTSRFVELGSGLGGNTLLAALLGYEQATGVEHDAELAQRARKLAARLELPATFHAGNFFPGDYTPPAEADAEALARYHFDGESVFQQADIAGHDCWLATPFPVTEPIIEHLFEQRARPGSLLLLYVGIGPVRLRTVHGDQLTYYGPECDGELAHIMERKEH